MKEKDFHLHTSVILLNLVEYFMTSEISKEANLISQVHCTARQALKETHTYLHSAPNMIR